MLTIFTATAPTAPATVPDDPARAARRVDPAVVARRRAANKVARKSRRANRSAR